MKSLEPLRLPTGLALPSIDRLKERSALATTEMDRVRAEDCPRCPTLDSPMGVDCRQSGLADDGNGAPLCKWADMMAQQTSAAARVRSRTDRLVKAQAVEPEDVASVASALAPPTPSTKWFPEIDLDRQREAHRAVLRFASGDGERVMLLSGVTGSGKSLLAAWLFAGVEDALWVSCPLANSPKTWEPLAPLIPDAPLVVFDDLGRERDGETKWASETLAEAVCAAIRRGQRVIVTTNLFLKRPAGSRVPGIEERYGARLFSSLTERAICISTGSTDIRVAKKAQQGKS